MDISLEEGNLMWVGLRPEKSGNPVGNLFACLLKCFGVTWLWSVEFSAVAAIVAVRNDRNLSEPWLRFTLGGPLPGVFPTVGKEDFVLSNAQAALVDRGSPGFWSMRIFSK